MIRRRKERKNQGAVKAGYFVLKTPKAPFCLLPLILIIIHFIKTKKGGIQCFLTKKAR